MGGTPGGIMAASRSATSGEYGGSTGSIRDVILVLLSGS
jgi:hypothetical protein